MAVTWQKTLAGYTAALGGNNVTITVPNGPSDGSTLAVGDLLVVHVSSAGAAQTWTGPSSWGGQAWTEAIDSQGNAVYWLYIANSTILAGATGTITCTKAGNTSQCGGTCTRYTGADPATPVDVVSVSNHQLTTPIANTVTPTKGNPYIAHYFLSNTSAGNSLTAPAASPFATIKHQSSPGSGIYVGVGEATGTYAAANATGLWTYSEGIAGAVWDSATVVIRNPPLAMSMDALSTTVTVHSPTVSQITPQPVATDTIAVAVSVHSPSVFAIRDLVLPATSFAATVHAPTVTTRLQKWRTALASVYAGTGDATCFCMGDSITEGFYAGANARTADMWVTNLGLRTASHVGLSKASLWLPTATGASTGIIYNWPEGTNPWTRAGSTVAANPNGRGQGGRRVIFQSIGDGDTTTVPAGFNHATFSCSGNGGTEIINIVRNGVTVQTVGIGPGGTSQTEFFIEQAVSPGDTIGIHMGSGSLGNLFVSGVRFEDRSTAPKMLRFIDGGNAGKEAADFAGHTLFLSQWWAPSLALHNPHLVTIELGVNDAQTPRSAANFETYLTEIVAMIDAACASNPNGVPDILFIAWPWVGQAAGIPTAGKYDAALWASYVQAMRNVAATLPFARADVLDLQAEGWLPPSTSGASTHYYDGVHPNAFGSDQVAAAVSAKIDPQGVTGVEVGVLAVPATVHDPAAAPGPVGLATQHLTVTPTVHSPAAAPGAVAVSLAAAAIVATVHQPAALPGQVGLTAQHLAVGVVLHTPAVAPGPIEVTCLHLQVAVTVPQPTVPALIAVAHLAVAVAVPGPQATPGPVSAATAHLTVAVVAAGPVIRLVAHVEPYERSYSLDARRGYNLDARRRYRV